MFAGDVRLEYSFMVSANRSRAEKLVGRKLKPLCPEWGPSMSPLRFKDWYKDSLPAGPWGTEKHPQLWFPRCSLCLPYPPPPPPSPFHSWNNVRASSFGLLHIPCQKQKPFLTPDDQACSRFVWYVASAWGWGGGWGGTHASNLYSRMPASRGAKAGGKKRPQGARSPESPRFQERRERERVREGPAGSGV